MQVKIFICDTIFLFPILLFTLINYYDGVSFSLSMFFPTTFTQWSEFQFAFTHGVGVTIKKWAITCFYLVRLFGSQALVCLERGLLMI
jgi:hypothetical protein